MQKRRPFGIKLARFQTKAFTKGKWVNHEEEGFRQKDKWVSFFLAYLIGESTESKEGDMTFRRFFLVAAVGFLCMIRAVIPPTAQSASPVANDFVITYPSFDFLIPYHPPIRLAA